MEITFTRSGERGYTTAAVRNDGVRLHIPSYDRVSPLPHDLAHYVVADRAGHAMHIALVSRLLREKSAWKLVRAPHASPVKSRSETAAIAASPAS